MALPTPPAAEALFGGRTRAAVLGYLAGAVAGSTGYAISKALRIGVSKVYPELRRLEKAGIVEGRPSPKGPKLFFLADDDLRRFLVRRVRILASQDWFLAERVAVRRGKLEAGRAIQLRAPAENRSRRQLPFADEFRRPAEKARALKRARRAPAQTR